MVGLQDHKISRALQLDPDLKLQKALLVARQHETVNQQQAELYQKREQEVHQVQSQRSTRQVGKNVPSPESGSDFPKPCGWCGRNRHSRASCPAKDAVCRKCDKRGHFEVVCRSTRAVRNVENRTEEPAASSESHPIHPLTGGKFQFLLNPQT